MKGCFRKLEWRLSETKRQFGEAKRRLVLLLCAFVLLVSCSKNRTQDEKTLFGEEQVKKEEVKIRRFDTALFDFGSKPTEEHLRDLEKPFAPMFAESLSNKDYMRVLKAFVEDGEMRRAAETVRKTYPDLKFLEDELSEAMTNIRKIRPDSCKTEIYTLVFGPAEYSYAYQNRILVYPEFSAISLDLYSISALAEHPYYKAVPEYLRSGLTRENLAPDYVKTYLQEITFRDVPLQSMNPDASLLDCIVDEGKYLYATAALLPKSPMYAIFRYTPEQYKWVEENEYNIWTYIIQRNLLYNKDRTKYLSLIAEGPSTKGIANSPSRIGNYIGYRIVEEFMDENPITLDSLFKISDSQRILKLSKYKPSKQ